MSLGGTGGGNDGGTGSCSWCNPSTNFSGWGGSQTAGGTNHESPQADKGTFGKGASSRRLTWGTRSTSLRKISLTTSLQGIWLMQTMIIVSGYLNPALTNKVSENGILAQDAVVRGNGYAIVTFLGQ